ncbi:nucleoside diphosphate kinase regulator [Chondromyces crocatus]|uniref:Elongation factor GreAB n=1 Tax=Chondromyces crocatus TaxID=52 RepID=A0A0K1ENJ9_CHOCO|nr:nucleoside diphosphate kinase regulator [Chondromyces crocatus]AKT42510.1 elongation factor GreAB [Chondromyces crocatus]
MSSSPPILVAAEDRVLLLQLIEQQPTTEVTELLDAELERARVVPRRDVPADVVVMNSEIEYEDSATGQRRRVQLVVPADADTSAGRVSVLAPLGCALLGLQVGQEIDWRMPGGLRRLRVITVKRPAEP